MWFLRIIPLACLPLAGVLNDNNVIEIMVITLFPKIPFVMVIEIKMLTITTTVIVKLTLYSPTSMCIFSILLPRHFLGFLQGEFVQQSRDYCVGDHLLYSHDLNV